MSAYASVCAAACGGGAIGFPDSAAPGAPEVLCPAGTLALRGGGASHTLIESLPGTDDKLKDTTKEHSQFTQSAAVASAPGWEELHHQLQDMAASVHRLLKPPTEYFVLYVEASDTKTIEAPSLDCYEQEAGEMQQQDLQPTDFTYTTVIRAFAKDEQPERTWT